MTIYRPSTDSATMPKPEEEHRFSIIAVWGHEVDRLCTDDPAEALDAAAQFIDQAYSVAISQRGIQ